jgi:hypothetical protein
MNKFNAQKKTFVDEDVLEKQAKQKMIEKN